MKLSQIWIDKLEDDDIPILEKAVATNNFGYTINHIIEEVAHLRMQLWRWKDRDAHFFILTRICEHPAGNELHMWAVGGSGYTTKLSDCYDALEAFMKREGCRWLTGQVNRKGFYRLYDKFGPLKKYGHWIKEI